MKKLVMIGLVLLVVVSIVAVAEIVLLDGSAISPDKIPLVSQEEDQKIKEKILSVVNSAIRGVIHEEFCSNYASADKKSDLVFSYIEDKNLLNVPYGLLKPSDLKPYFSSGIDVVLKKNYEDRCLLSEEKELIDILDNLEVYYNQGVQKNKKQQRSTT